MKKILYFIIAASALVACQKKQPIITAVNGSLSFTLDVDREGDYLSKSALPDVNAFVVDIVRPEDGYLIHFDRLDEIPEVLEIGSGDYTITATSAEYKPVAWDQPVYGASADFTIRVGELTPLSLVATLQNMKVTFRLTERFTKELSNYTVSVTNATSWEETVPDVNTLIWDKTAVDGGRPGYFSVAPLMVKVDGYRQDGNIETHAGLIISDVAPRDHHIITLDARVTGSVNGISLLVDDSVNDKESDVLVDGWGEVPVDGGENGGDDGGDEPSTAPTMTWEANPDFLPTPIQASMNVEILIKAPETIKSFLVLVDSNVLSETIAQMAGNMAYTYSPGNPFVMDLIEDEALTSVLSGIIPVKDQLYGQKEVLFSLSQLVPLVLGFSPESGSVHTFTLKVTDAIGQSLEKSIDFVMP